MEPLLRPEDQRPSARRARRERAVDRMTERWVQTSLDSTMSSTARPCRTTTVTESIRFATISGSSIDRSPPTVKWWKDRIDVVSTTSNLVRFHKRCIVASSHTVTVLGDSSTHSRMNCCDAEGALRSRTARIFVAEDGVVGRRVELTVGPLGVNESNERSGCAVCRS